MAKYAATTTVSSEKSLSEIRGTLSRYGAHSFMFAETGGHAIVVFEAEGRRIRFTLPMPDKNAREFTHTPSRGTLRTGDQQYEAWEQACRQRWRALALAIKAKLEAVDAHIATFEEEFMGYIVLPGSGQTIGEWMSPQIETAYQNGKMPPLLPAYNGG